MKYIKLMRFDLQYGILKSYRKYLLFFLLVALAFFECQATLLSYGKDGATCADYLLYIYGGMKEYIPIPGEIFKIPYLWLLNHIIILYFTLNYMYQDLTGYGQQIIYRSGSRNAWWLSKCVWQLSSVLLYYLIAWLEILGLSAITGVQISGEISSFMTEIMDFGGKMLPIERLDLLLEITLLPLLFTLALGFLQLTLCLFLKPTFSYIITTVVCVSSAYTIHNFLIGNFAMALRSDKVISNGVNMAVGILVFAGIVIGSVLAGFLKFRNYNILSKE